MHFDLDEMFLSLFVSHAGAPFVPHWMLDTLVAAASKQAGGDSNCSKCMDRCPATAFCQMIVGSGHYRDIDVIMQS